MNRAQTVRHKRDAIRRIARRYGAVDIRLFGSVARGEDTTDSDIDFLVELEEGRSLLDLGGMLMELREELGAEVDLTNLSSLPPERKAQILQDATPV